MLIFWIIISGASRLYAQKKGRKIAHHGKQALKDSCKKPRRFARDTCFLEELKAFLQEEGQNFTVIARPWGHAAWVCGCAEKLWQLQVHHQAAQAAQKTQVGSKLASASCEGAEVMLRMRAIYIRVIPTSRYYIFTLPYFYILCTLYLYWYYSFMHKNLFIYIIFSISIYHINL